MTHEKNRKFMILKTRKFKSGDRKDDGAISRIQIQTPQAQVRLISLEDFLWMILKIKGIFQNGRTKAPTIEIFSKMLIQSI